MADKNEYYQAGLHALDGVNEAIKADTETLKRQLAEQQSHRVRQLETVQDLPLMMQLVRSEKLSTQEATNRAVIHQWDDGYGNIIYLNPNIGPDQVPVVATKIRGQRTTFNALGADEQSRIRTGLGATAENTIPYQDFLKSEALGKRFQELKQKEAIPPK